ncbi:Uncharacterised protein [Vibrio cholerae]|nr:Uncharacterised protein [Vibrio cholerae]
MILRANPAPKIRTVRSVAKKINGKVNAPHVVWKPKMVNGICTR